MIKFNPFTNNFDFVGEDSGASAFIGLTDTPNSFTGQALKGTRVNSAEDAIEFYTTTDSDEKVKLNASDPTAGYLDDKVATYGFLTDISGQDLSTADNSTSLFITLADVPAETDPVWNSEKGDYLTSATASTTYLKLDTSNDPLTGDLEISKADPEIRLVDSGNNEYTRITKQGVFNRATRYNRIAVPTSPAQAIKFNGSTGYAYIPSNSTQRGMTELTFSFWLKIDANTGNNRYLIRKQSYPHSDYWYAVMLWGDNTLRFQASDASFVTQGVHSSSTYTTADGWIHVGCVFKGGEYIRLYVNGALQAERTEDVIAAINGSSRAIPLTLNAFHEGTSYYHKNLNGKLDEVLMMNRALALSEIQELSSGLYPTLEKQFSSTGNVIGNDTFALLHFNGTLNDETGQNNATAAGGWSYDNDFAIPSESFPAEIILWESENSPVIGEKGIQTFGDKDGRTVIEGKSTRFNNQGTEMFQIDSSGDLVFPDNYEVYWGTGKDASIYYDGVNVIVNPKEVGTGGVKVLGGLLVTDGGLDPAVISTSGLFDVSRGGASTNSILTVERLWRSTTGTPADGLGGAFSMRVENSVGAGANAGYFSGRLMDVTSGSEIGEVLMTADWKSSTALTDSRSFRVLATSATSADTYFPNGDVRLQADSKKLIFGAEDDASIYYDGTDLIINPQEVGSGKLDVQGTIQTDGYNSSDGTAGATGTIDLTTATSITIKDGLITAWS